MRSASRECGTNPTLSAKIVHSEKLARLADVANNTLKKVAKVLNVPIEDLIN